MKKSIFMGIKTKIEQDDDVNKKSDRNNISELEVKIVGFFDTDLTITEAKKYEVKLKNGLNFNDLADILASVKKLKSNDKQDILVNGFSIKNDKIVARYLQQNCLFLNKNAFLDEKLSVYDNIKVVSIMYSGYNLADACLSSFSIKDLATKKVDELTNEQKQMIILSYTVCCPAIIWLIDGNLLNNLSKNQLDIVENSIKIRLKHGGVVLKII